MICDNYAYYTFHFLCIILIIIIKLIVYQMDASNKN